MRVASLLAVLTAALAYALTINTSNAVVSPKLQGYMGPVELGGGLFVVYKIRPADFCVVVNATNVTITDFRVRCSAGILVADSRNVTISRGVLEGNLGLPVYLRGAGIYIYNSTGVVVKDVYLIGFHDGIYVERSGDVRIENATVVGSRYGVHIMFSKSVAITDVSASHNYVGIAVMYSQDALVENSTLVANVDWSEGYGLFIADVANGTFIHNISIGNVHGIYILVMDANETSITVAGNLVKGNYIGLTYRGISSPGVRIVDNVFAGNSIPALYVDIFLGGGELNAEIRGNEWQGHASTSPYVYRSAFAEVLVRSDLLLAPISASPARFLVDSFGVGNVAFIDPSPRPYGSPPLGVEMAAALAMALVWLAARRRL